MNDKKLIPSYFTSTKFEKFLDLKIGICHGVFDVLHLGHIQHFKEAKEYCDKLIVSVTSDEFVNKGPGKPIFNLEQRIELLASIEQVDFVIESHHETAIDNLKLIRPDFYFKGQEYRDNNDVTGNISKEEKFCVDNGIEIHYTSGFTSSSSKIINQNYYLNESQLKHIQDLKQLFSINKIQTGVNNFKNKKILLIGEGIIDQYSYTKPLGISSKDSVIAVEKLNSELFLGGSLAVANHLSGLGCETFLPVKMCGEKNIIDYIEKNLKDNVHIDLISQIGNESENNIIIKERVVDEYSDSKILEFYHQINKFSVEFKKNLYYEIKQILIENSIDLILFTDYGHGLVDKNLIEYCLTSGVPVVANAQSNAGNRGYNSAIKFSGANLVTLAYHELEILLQRKNCEESDFLIAWDLLGKKTLIITLGKNGAVLINSKGEIFRAPSFANIVRDRVGAGDAFLTLAALAKISDLDPQVILFLGGLAGAISVQHLANSMTVETVYLNKFVKSILS
jgi:cytidyltransferase-like protein